MRHRHPFKKTKFNAKRTERDGFSFDSEAEAEYYDHLKELKESGEILFFLRQVPFDLRDGEKYRTDFQIFWANGEITFEDVKGMETPEFIRKKKVVERMYPVEIEIIKKRKRKAGIVWQRSKKESGE